MFEDQLAGWGGFATMLGTAAATLMGLLFVAVSLNGRAITEKTDEKARLMAINTFAGFLFLLLYSLYLLIPDQTQMSLGVSFVITALFQAQTTLQEVPRIWRESSWRGAIRSLLWRQALPFLSTVLIAVFGVLLIGDWSTDLDLLLYAFFSLLIGSTMNAWFLLLRLSAADASPVPADVD